MQPFKWIIRLWRGWWFFYSFIWFWSSRLGTRRFGRSTMVRSEGYSTRPTVSTIDVPRDRRGKEATHNKHPQAFLVRLRTTTKSTFSIGCSEHAKSSKGVASRKWPFFWFDEVCSSVDKAFQIPNCRYLGRIYCSRQGHDILLCYIQVTNKTNQATTARFLAFDCTMSQDEFGLLK